MCYCECSMVQACEYPNIEIHSRVAWWHALQYSEWNGKYANDTMATIIQNILLNFNYTIDSNTNK